MPYRAVCFKSTMEISEHMLICTFVPSNLQDFLDAAFARGAAAIALAEQKARSRENHRTPQVLTVTQRTPRIG